MPEVGMILKQEMARNWRERSGVGDSNLVGSFSLKAGLGGK